MRVVHVENGVRKTLASDVEVADSLLSQARGLMFRRSVPDDYALVFEFDGQSRRDLHMLFVPFPVDAVWLCDSVVQQVDRLAPWIGRGHAVADTVIELPAGAAEGVAPGDRVAIEAD